MKKRVFAGSLALLAAVSAFAAATAGASSQGDQLIGAGSTFVSPLVSQWQKDYPSKTGVNIVYQPIGSGGGIAAIQGRTVDFGASDAPLSPSSARARAVRRFRGRSGAWPRWSTSRRTLALR